MKRVREKFNRLPFTWPNMTMFSQRLKEAGRDGRENMYLHCLHSGCWLKFVLFSLICVPMEGWRTPESRGSLTLSFLIKAFLWWLHSSSGAIYLASCSSGTLNVHKAKRKGWDCLSDWLETGQFRLTFDHRTSIFMFFPQLQLIYVTHVSTDCLCVHVRVCFLCLFCVHVLNLITQQFACVCAED